MVCIKVETNIQSSRCDLSGQVADVFFQNILLKKPESYNHVVINSRHGILLYRPLHAGMPSTLQTLRALPNLASKRQKPCIITLHISGY